MVKLIQSSFAKGEVAPALYGRVDTRAYHIALRKAYNAVVHQYGGISNRPGTMFVGPVKDHTSQTRLIPFQFKTTDTHILEFGNEYIRFIRNDGHITETEVNITGATAANPVVVTTSGSHGYSNGDEVFISSVGGMTEINNTRFTVANVSATTFELTDQVTGSNINGTSYTAYTSGGTSARIYTVTTPYTSAQLRDLNFAQTADVVTIVHPSHPPKKLTRSALASWSLDDIVFKPSVTFPTAITASSGSGSATEYTVTVIDEDGNESLAGLGASPGSVNITAITKANPGVVTATSHGYANGDRIYVQSVGGMTELNDRQFVVANVTANTLELLGEDTTNYTTYTSGGTVQGTFTSHSNDTNVTLTWSSVTEAVRYRVFKLSQGVFGFIGSTQGTSFTDAGSVTPDISDTPPIQFEPFLGTGNQPSAVGYHQQRAVMGGSDNKPDTSYFSVVGDTDDFSKRVPLQSDDGFSATLASDQVNRIKHYVSLRSLLTFTTGSEWSFSSTSGAGRFSSDTLSADPQTHWGANNMPPIVIGNAALFVNETSNRVRGTSYSFSTDNYIAEELSLFVPHMFRNKQIVEWSNVRSPDPIIFMVRDDGELLTMTYNREQEVTAWTTWGTDGSYESTAAIRPSISSDSEEAYFVVKRTVNGNTVRYIERTKSRLFDDVRDCFFVDCGLSVDNPISITGITLANPGVITTSAAHGLADGDEVDISDITWVVDTDQYGNETQPAQLNNTRYVVANSTSTTFTLQDPDTAVDVDTTSFNAYVESGFVRQAVGSISGLAHLANSPVTILADGNVISNLTVSSTGGLTLPRNFSRIHIGLPYFCDIQTLDPEPDSDRRVVAGKKKNIPRVTVRFEKSRGLWIGPDELELREMKQREFENYGDPTSLYTGDKEIDIVGKWSSHGRLYMRQRDPLPLTILALVPEVNIGTR